MRGMDKFSFFILFGLSTPFVNAQNLVPNSSFEEVSTCNVSSLYDAMENSIVDWETYDYSTNSPDIFNECFSSGILQLPNSAFGYTFAQIGQGCAGLGFIPSTDHREVISVQLTNQLQQDSAYCVSFFVKNSKSENQEYYAKNLGVVFTQNPTNYSEVRSLEPAIFSELEITQNEWVEISGYYIASGTENYLHIGYWGNNLDYQNATDSQGLIYYYVDNINLITCNKDSLLSVVLELPNVITPNGDQINDLYNLKTHNIKSLEVQVYNRWGSMVLSYDGLKDSWDGNDQSGQSLVEGVYFVNVIAETKFGELLTKNEFVHLER